ncbi:unnamed protein product [Acanthosepion pharaonis]|uniref:F-box domain-containing protein n=1 Tax=Acanthosepion pharaonis TaxID=158019 RepID=A0A812EIE5_ACAPH|nr:unnamed protein product [Sepia pharaonis]
MAAVDVFFPNSRLDSFFLHFTLHLFLPSYIQVELKRASLFTSCHTFSLLFLFVFFFLIFFLFLIFSFSHFFLFLIFFFFSFFSFSHFFLFLIFFFFSFFSFFFVFVYFLSLFLSPFFFFSLYFFLLSLLFFSLLVFLFILSLFIFSFYHSPLLWRFPVVGILLHIIWHIAITSKRLREACANLLEERGLVTQIWQKEVLEGSNKCHWKVAYKKWNFSPAFTPVKFWGFNGHNPLSEHLKVCPFNQDPARHSQPFHLPSDSKAATRLSHQHSPKHNPDEQQEHPQQPHPFYAQFDDVPELNLQV